ncbi:MAG: GvpL/GvpF family gas vesicle protein [Patescibacteria group bacterium]
MNNDRKYIYSIISTQDLFAETLEELRGMNNCDIVLVSYKDIAAVVSDTHVIHFDKLDKTELTRCIALHDQVNTGLMKKHNVVPMRFGMIVESTEEILMLLAKAYIQFKTALDSIAGKAEFTVQVCWNTRNILEKIVQENTEIQALKKEVESKGGILGFASKVKLGKCIHEAVELRRKEYTKNIIDTLAAYFPQYSAGKLLNADTGKEMIVNYSFLIDKTEEPAFDARLNTLAETYKDELQFKCIGPMPPYSFAVINFSAGNFDVVDRARRTLRLGESATRLEIRKMYYALAEQYHPDKHVHTNVQKIIDEAEMKMKDLATANEVLTVYCQQYLSALPSGEEQICSFKKEDVGRIVMVS